MLFGEELRAQTLVEFDRTGVETQRSILRVVLDCTSHYGLMAFDLRDLFDRRRLLKRAPLVSFCGAQGMKSRPMVKRYWG